MSNQAPQLTAEDAHNALAFLERVSTKGVKEAVVKVGETAVSIRHGS